MTRPRQNVPPETAEIRHVERAAAVLSQLEREVLVLSAGLGLRNEEIAARLCLSERRTERVLANALRKFDRALERQERPWWKFW